MRHFHEPGDNIFLAIVVVLAVAFFVSKFAGYI